MTAANRALITFCLLLAAALGAAQSIPELIPTKELPGNAICVKCKEGEEPVHAGFRFQKQTLYFCNQSEVDEFLANPAAFLSQEESPVKVPT